ncbi:hypothetical protein GGR51DRAFT_567407 [Nemania sp. FL0031]|nr:hypothetical protein GGR51DRAFT_567407 [Nemania sp. FL0031]
MSFDSYEYWTSSSEGSDSHEDIDEGVENAIQIPIADADPLIMEGESITDTDTDVPSKTEPEPEPEPITDIALWPELAKYITAFTPARLEDLEIDREVWIQLKCEICLDKYLRLPNWVGSWPGHGKRNSEAICVLPCGHFFGKRCIQKWVLTLTQEQKSTPPVCPKCRFHLVHPKCKHPIKLRAVHTRQLSATNPRLITRCVPLTRVHELDPTNPDKFVDMSLWDPAESDSAHNFGVTDECYDCEKMRVIAQWERERELEQGEVPRWWR